MKYRHQSPAAVVMVRPHHFLPNPETAADNTFQKNSKLMSTKEVATKAFDEVSKAIDTLRALGVVVFDFDDFSTETPDSVFPNNWFTTHEDGSIAIFPMYCENRRKEKNQNIINLLSKKYQVSQVRDYSRFETEGLFLEGTGAMVFDHPNRLVYAVISNRMSEIVLKQFCQDFGYTPQVFQAVDDKNMPIYHTNVLMSIATDFVLIGLDCIKDLSQRAAVLHSFTQTNKEVIALSIDQVCQFAGNAIELITEHGNILAISSTAYNSLNAHQIIAIEKYVNIVPIEVPTIELAGGSIRCMLAGIHLPKKQG